MKSIKDIKNLSNKRVLVRVDYNGPIKLAKHQGGISQVVDDFRIKKTLLTIKYLSEKGAKVILISHLGDDGKASLEPVGIRLKKYIPKARFINTSILSDETERIIKNLKKGDIILLENLRSEEGEKKNSPSFARALSRYADIYVNEAFSASHRQHASIVGITKYLPGYAGLQFISEINNLSKAFNPKKPFLFILGGAKFETKIPLIKKLIRNTDFVFISGAISNDFFKIKGYEIGISLTDSGSYEIPILLKNKKLSLPLDVKVISGMGSRFTKPEEVKVNEKIVDIGPQTISFLKELIKKSQFILWNGPLGLYEDGFDGATKKIIKYISKSKTESIIGGGDTVAIISKLKFENKLGFVSTGGGAILDFLIKGSLPGIKVLK